MNECWVMVKKINKKIIVLAASEMLILEFTIVNKIYLIWSQKRTILVEHFNAKTGSK